MTQDEDISKESEAAAADRLVRKLRFGHLLLLDAVERLGTLQQAADELNLSRSAVGKSLSEIESATRYSLFERTQRGLKPSEAGMVFVRGARRMLHDLRATTTDASLARHGDSSLLRVGAAPFLGGTLAPAVIELALGSLPGLQVRLTQARFPQLVEALHDARLDCLLTSVTMELVQPEVARNLHIEPLYTAPHSILAPRKPPWTRRRVWQLKDLATARWVMLPRSGAWRQTLESAFLNAGCKPPEPVVETNVVFSHAALAAAANALVLLPQPLVPDALQDGKLIALKVDPVPGIESIAFVTGNRTSPSLEVFRIAAHAVATRFSGPAPRKAG